MKEQEMKKPKKERKKPMTDECTHQDENETNIRLGNSSHNSKLG